MLTQTELKNKIKQIPFVKQILNHRNEKRYRLNFEKKIRENPPVYVFQMGKVGSSSAFHSIKKQYKGFCLRSHWFSSQEADIRISTLYKIYQKEKFPIKIISMLREPVSRNISAFFQNFERDTGVNYKEHNFSLEEIRELFLKNYKHQMPLTWLDDNINNHFDIDVYASSFPEEGYKVYKNESIELLLYKHDIEDVIKEELIAGYLQIPDFKLSNINEAGAKEYAATYKEFIKMDMPKTYLDMMLNSKYSRQFYAEDVIKIRKKWSKNAD